MPQMANIVIKDAANADVTATALTPSAGDSSTARWRVEDLAVPPMFRPEFAVLARPSSDKTSRRVQMKLTVPYAITGTDGLTKKSGNILTVCDFVVPQDIPTATVEDAVAYTKSFISSSLISAVLGSQIAPT